VRDASIVIRTASETVNAKPFSARWPTRMMPSIETMTTEPAKTTALPAVATALRVARRGSCPSARPVRKRVTMSNA
jgi:hypothetical protein